MAVRFSQTPCVKPALGARRRVASRVICSASTGSVACTSRRSLLLAGLIAVPAAELLLPSVRPAHAETQSFAEDAVDEYSRLEASGKLTNAKALENIRSKFNFKRSIDGRVFVKSSKGTFFAVRLDMEVPGAMLFRDSSNGQIFALQTTTLQQIDLSNDQVVILLLSDGEWEREMSPIQFDDDAGKTTTLTLSENDFRNVVGLISMAEGAEAGQEAK
ncbi:hypothetical protein CHLRE_12g497850v5 [Chlamydomonas reinhardtii]|uniref:Uncharacterized protein n=1 Tax=Chlamydomonas reinhardtii TaxID=3055 RepID=A8JGL0_CHLRE|nr:uncharacterized protein CHLRE_12g497850v5 [Chlamydomonas reinhardtii]PNW75071.1 hypothetical protein CHLRE_12g497850v5 [Chlamydomonas reinhardtii]|eukprot:XP_001702387.1 predicted protein [Chlamydomonas reinhardtii]